MGPSTVSKWINISLACLLLVATMGVLMRYKIGFSFPLLDQRNLQHAHSHFAFAGWVSQLLMFLMIRVISPAIPALRMKRYRNVLWLNLVTALGMLICFLIQGYALYSIIFSTASIIISFIFCAAYYYDIRNNWKASYNKWFLAALLFNILSSLGTFELVYMMATKTVEQHKYLAAVYWYLHFQYNGWFLFACIGLYVHYITTTKPAIIISDRVFWLFAISCIPAYGLSVLWAHLPVLLYAIVVLAALGQFYAWIFLVKTLKDYSFISTSVPATGKYLLWFVAIAFTIKLSLQLGSVIPSISKLAFGFRTIVIAYLHLVLLAITSVFLIAYCMLNGLLNANKTTNIAIVLFLVGVFLNEIVLAVQGIASFGYVVFPFVNVILFVVSILLFISILLLLVAQQPFVRIKRS